MIFITLLDNSNAKAKNRSKYREFNIEVQSWGIYLIINFELWESFFVQILNTHERKYIPR